MHSININSMLYKWGNFLQFLSLLLSLAGMICLIIFVQLVVPFVVYLGALCLTVLGAIMTYYSGRSIKSDSLLLQNNWKKGMIFSEIGFFLLTFASFFLIGYMVRNYSLSSAFLDLRLYLFIIGGAVLLFIGERLTNKSGRIGPYLWLRIQFGSATGAGGAGSIIPGSSISKDINSY